MLKRRRLFGNRRTLSKDSKEENLFLSLPIEPPSELHSSTLTSFTEKSSTNIGEYTEGRNIRCYAIATVNCRTPTYYDICTLPLRKYELIEVLSLNPNGLWYGRKRLENSVGEFEGYTEGFFKFIHVSILPQNVIYAPEGHPTDENTKLATTDGYYRLAIAIRNSEKSATSAIEENRLSYKEGDIVTVLSDESLQSGRWIGSKIENGDNKIGKISSSDFMLIPRIIQLKDQTVLPKTDEKTFENFKSFGMTGNDIFKLNVQDVACNIFKVHNRWLRPHRASIIISRLKLQRYIPVLVLNGFDDMKNFKSLNGDILDKLEILMEVDRKLLLLAAKILTAFDLNFPVKTCVTLPDNESVQNFFSSFPDEDAVDKYIEIEEKWSLPKKSENQGKVHPIASQPIQIHTASVKRKGRHQPTISRSSSIDNHGNLKYPPNLSNRHNGVLGSIFKADMEKVKHEGEIDPSSPSLNSMNSYMHDTDNESGKSVDLRTSCQLSEGSSRTSDYFSYRSTTSSLSFSATSQSPSLFFENFDYHDSVFLPPISNSSPKESKKYSWVYMFPENNEQKLDYDNHANDNSLTSYFETWLYPKSSNFFDTGYCNDKRNSLPVQGENDSQVHGNLMEISSSDNESLVSLPQIIRVESKHYMQKDTQVNKDSLISAESYESLHYLSKPGENHSDSVIDEGFQENSLEIETKNDKHDSIASLNMNNSSFSHFRRLSKSLQLDILWNLDSSKFIFPCSKNTSKSVDSFLFSYGDNSTDFVSELADKPQFNKIINSLHDHRRLSKDFDVVLMANSEFDAFENICSTNKWMSLQSVALNNFSSALYYDKVKKSAYTSKSLENLVVLPGKIK